jgi:pimeloyl-ACP methyl ester carboxylesterase
LPTFLSNGVEIAYIDERPDTDAGTPILLIHGFASSLRVNWVDTGWVKHLNREGYRVIALDNRGHGQSQKLYSTDDYRLPVIAEDARALLDHLSIAQAHVMGYSMGAKITALLALQHPARVRSAIFAGMGIHMVRGLSGAEAIAAALEAPTINDVTDASARTFRLFADQTKSDLLALAACVRAIREPVTADVVAGIHCPVLVAVGTADTVAGSAAELAALIPGAEVLDITGRDHMRAAGDRIYKDGVVDFLKRRG